MKRCEGGGWRKERLTIWVVRHGERADNVDRKWRHRARASGSASWDDSPLSTRGRLQAGECSFRLSGVNFDFVFTSPFTRCLETCASIMINRWTKIKVEPGLCELLSLCDKPPGFPCMKEVRRCYKHIDPCYIPVIDRHELRYEKETSKRDDTGCLHRVSEIMQTIVRDCFGNVLIVTHGAVVGAIHELLVGGWLKVGQATLTKFVEQEPGVFTCEFGDNSSHLFDPTMLRRC